MALAGGTGAHLKAYDGALPEHAYWFGEDQGRYVLAVPMQNVDLILKRAKSLALQAEKIGRTGGDKLSIKDGDSVSLAELRDVHEGWLPGYMDT